MKRTCCRLVVLLSAALLTGCVERRFVIESAPAGAQVLRNGQPVGFTPVDDSFVYYGQYDFTLIKDGYETLHVKEKVRAPWYQFPVIDFVSENLIPWKIRDVRRLRYEMQPLQPVKSEDVLRRAQELREQGRLIGDQPYVPRPAQPATPPATVEKPVDTPPSVSDRRE